MAVTTMLSVEVRQGTQPPLPVELLNHIFNFLRTSSDIRSLRACSHASKLFLSLTEPHMYRHLSLTSEKAHRSITEAYSCAEALDPVQVFKLISAHPHIAKYVRSLEIHLGCTSERGDSWVRSILEADIACLLPLLCEVENVTLIGRGYGKTLWTELDEGFQVAFAQTLALQSVKEVTLREIDECELDEVFNGVTSLERLSLSGSFNFEMDGFYDSPESLNLALVPLHASRAKLQSLILQDCDTIPAVVSWLGSKRGVDVSQLAHLEATRHGEEDYVALSHLLVLCKDNLATLQMEPGRYDANFLFNTLDQEDPPTPLMGPILPERFFSLLPSLSSLSALQSLKLALQIETLRNIRTDYTGEECITAILYKSPFLWLQKLLNEFAVPRSNPNRPRASGSAPASLQTSASASKIVSNLKHLVLDIFFEVDLPSLDKISWTSLASALESLADNVPSLESVHIRVISYLYEEEGAEQRKKGRLRIVQALEEDEGLAVLVGKGLLKVSLSRRSSLEDEQDD